MILFTVGWFLFAIFANAQENSDCLTCHTDQTITKKIVDEKKVADSIHARLQCINCHNDLEGKELPHESELKPVNCGACHSKSEEEFKDSLHGKALLKGDKLAPRCQSCHGNHDILPVKDPKSAVATIRIPFVCGACHSEGSPVQRQREIHQDHILENYSESIHGEGLLKKGLSVTATCASCHTAHQILPHTDSRSSIARTNIVKTCTKCHVQIEDVHRKVIKGELWEKQPHVIPVCVECHQPHKARKVFYDQGMADRDCLSCHGKEEMKTAQGISMQVKTEELKNSIHKKTACAQCHTGVSPSKRRPCETVIKKVDCAVCHTRQVEEFQISMHGKLLKQNDPNAPHCIECHGRHDVKSKQDFSSRTFPINVPSLCAKCHREGEKAAMRYKGKEHEITKHYTESIHGKGLLKSGLVVTAMCTNCHTAHRELPANDPNSTVNNKNIAVTCSQCHYGVYEKYIQSIHSPLVSKTDKELPTCKECHSAHTIKRTDHDTFRLEIMSKCGRCHMEIAKTYFETYHGKVSQLGYVKTAKCYDCHGAHNILPVTNPNSSLSRQNILTTCKQCHSGATRKFAGYLTHATHHDPKKYPFIFWSFWAMTALLIGTFIVAGIHTLLWLPRTIQMRKLHLSVSYNPNEKQYERFKPMYRILHVVMIVSFMSLALTGMTLKFSYTKWAVVLSRVLGGFESAGYIHRISAILMFVIFLTHIYDLLRLKRQRYGTLKAMLFVPDSLLLSKKDLKEFFASLKWFLGLADRPQYGRWTYWEKFDYFAVFWGIAIIGSTGLMLWFSEFFTRFLPGSLLNVATIIHSDEALLAVGFIFTIHFFNTHFRPDKFPMDTVIFTGRISLEEFKRDKPAEYETLAANGELEKYLVDPPSPVMIKAIRIFAWTALVIGLSLVIGIIYAMVFAYK